VEVRPLRDRDELEAGFSGGRFDSVDNIGFGLGSHQ